MQANASSKTGHKFWCVVAADGHMYLRLVFGTTGCAHNVVQAHDITGASPAYVEALVEELNISANTMLYNLGRIAV